MSWRLLCSLMPSLSRRLIVLLTQLFGECVQNFGEEICCKTFIWKTGSRWKDNMTNFREMDSEDGR
jgi:hypothetical protein